MNGEVAGSTGGDFYSVDNVKNLLSERRCRNTNLQGQSMIRLRMRFYNGERLSC